MSVFFDQAEKLMEKGDKITPEDIKMIEEYRFVVDQDEIEKIDWLLEGIYQNVGTDPKFAGLL